MVFTEKEAGDKPDRYAGRPGKVLVVDDHETVLAGYKKFVELYGLECVAVRDMRQAIDQIQGQNFGLVILDGLDGGCMAVVDYIGQDPARLSTPVMIASTHDYSEFSASRTAAGMDVRYIIKGHFDPMGELSKLAEAVKK